MAGMYRYSAPSTSASRPFMPTRRYWMGPAAWQAVEAVRVVKLSFGQGIGGAGAHIVNAVIAPAPHCVAGQQAQRTAAAVAAAHHQGVVGLVDQQALVVVHQLVRRALKQDMALGVQDLARGVYISGLGPGHRSGGPRRGRPGSKPGLGPDMRSSTVSSLHRSFIAAHAALSPHGNLVSSDH